MYQSEIETPRNDASVGGVFSINEQQVAVHSSQQTGFYLPYDIRHMEPIMINGDKCIVVVSNNDIVRIIKTRSQEQQEQND